MVIATHPLTNAEFWELLPTLDPDKRYELIDGELIEMAPSTRKNSYLAATLVEFLGAFVRKNNLGYVFGADGGYDVAPGSTLIPDVSFISKQSSPEFPQGNHIPPDLVIEVISPSETPRSITTKTGRYLKMGAKQVWNIYPEDQVVEIWRMGENDELRMQALTADMVLTGGEVLPGFELPLRTIFPE
jgi:Uma2 family endonuclease